MRQFLIYEHNFQFDNEPSRWHPFGRLASWPADRSPASDSDSDSVTDSPGTGSCQSPLLSGRQCRPVSLWHRTLNIGR